MTVKPKDYLNTEDIHFLTTAEVDALAYQYGDLTAELVKWIESVRFQVGLIEGVLDGRVKVTGFDDGDPLVSLTDKGKEFVERDLLGLGEVDA